MLAKRECVCRCRTREAVRHYAKTVGGWLIRGEIVLQRPLGLKVEGFAKLGEIV